MPSKHVTLETFFKVLLLPLCVFDLDYLEYLIYTWTAQSCTCVCV